MNVLSHAASFAPLVYASSWLKSNEPEAFLAVTLMTINAQGQRLIQAAGRNEMRRMLARGTASCSLQRELAVA